MSLLLDTYRRNADAARAEARRTTLPNVRDRFTEAAEVSEALAERLASVESQTRGRNGW